MATRGRLRNRPPLHKTNFPCKTTKHGSSSLLISQNTGPTTAGVQTKPPPCLTKR